MAVVIDCIIMVGALVLMEMGVMYMEDVEEEDE